MLPIMAALLIILACIVLLLVLRLRSPLRQTFPDSPVINGMKPAANAAADAPEISNFVEKLMNLWPVSLWCEARGTRKTGPVIRAGRGTLQCIGKDASNTRDDFEFSQIEAIEAR